MRKIVNRRIRRQGQAGNVVADVTAVVAGNTGGTARVTAQSGGKKIEIVQRDGRTEVTES